MKDVKISKITFSHLVVINFVDISTFSHLVVINIVDISS